MGRCPACYLYYRPVCHPPSRSLFHAHVPVLTPLPYDRICILNAFLSQGNGQYGQAVGLYKRALAILDWGRDSKKNALWAKATRKERGAVFDSTFVRGVRTMYAMALVHVGSVLFSLSKVL